MWQTYTGDGSKGPFTFTFGASNVNQILCIVSTGYGDMTLNGADFSVTLNKDQDNNPGGIVTLDQVLPIGHYLTVGLVGQIVQTPNSVERRKGARSDVVCRHLKSIEDQYRESVFKTEKIYTDCADKLDDFTESEKKVITDKLDKVNSDIDSMKTESEGRLSALETSVTNTENNINQQIENTKANVDNKLLVIKQAIEVNGQNIQKNKENIAANDTAIKTNLASINSLKTRVTKTEQDITANKTAVEERVTTLESTSSDHETRIKANETELADHEKRITTNAADIDKLETRATNLESTVGEHTVSIESHESRLNNIETTTDAGKWAEKLAALDAKDEELETSITNLPDKYVTLDTAQTLTGKKTLSTTNKSVVTRIIITNNDNTVTPTENVWTNAITATDKNNKGIGSLQFNRLTNGSNQLNLQAVNQNANGNDISVGLSVALKSDGTSVAKAPNTPSNAVSTEIATAKFVTDKITPINTALSQEVTDRTKAISDLKTSLASDYVTLKTAQTITAVKSIKLPSNQHAIKLIASDSDNTVAPSASTWQSMIIALDKNNKERATVQATLDPNGASRTKLMAIQQNSSGANVYNSLELSIKADGTQTTKIGASPASNSNDTSIATTAWVTTKISAETTARNTAITNAKTDINNTKVTTNTAQTISGAKTFSAAVKGLSFTATSDKRLKDNIKEVSFDLSSLKTYSYSFKEDKEKMHYVGLIAQEVEPIIPDAIRKDDKGYLSLDYNAIVAALVGEVNALKKRIEVLENK